MFETPRYNERRLVQDIWLPYAGGKFDVRNEHVRQKSIGYLDAQYFQYMRGSNIAVNSSGDEGAVKVAVRRARHYTRIPPLATFPTYGNNAWVAWIEHYTKEIKEGYEFLVAVVSATLSDAISYLNTKLHDVSWLPKRYALSKGLYTDWNTKTFKTAKWSAPAMILLGALLLGVILWQVSPPPSGTEKPTEPSKSHEIITTVRPSKFSMHSHKSSTAGKSTSSVAGSTTSGGTDAGPVNTRTGSSTVPGLPVLPVTSTPVDPIPIKTPIGGLGGGDSTTPIPSLPPSTTVIDPTTTTTPVPSPTSTLTPTLTPLINQPLVTSTVQQVTTEISTVPSL